MALITGAFMAGQNRNSSASPVTSVSAASFGAAAQTPGQFDSFPSGLSLLAGDRLVVQLNWAGSTAAPTFSLSAGWTLVAAETVFHSVSLRSRVEWWEKNTPASASGTAGWAADAPAVTASYATRWGLTALAFRGPWVQVPITETLAGGTSTLTPTLDVTPSVDALVIGLMYGGQSSGGAQDGPDYNPSGTTQGDWSEIVGDGGTVTYSWGISLVAVVAGSTASPPDPDVQLEHWVGGRDLVHVRDPDRVRPQPARPSSPDLLVRSSGF